MLYCIPNQEELVASWWWLSCPPWLSRWGGGFLLRMPFYPEAPSAPWQQPFPLSPTTVRSTMTWVSSHKSFLFQFSNQVDFPKLFSTRMYAVCWMWSIISYEEGLLKYTCMLMIEHVTQASIWRLWCSIEIIPKFFCASYSSVTSCHSSTVYPTEWDGPFLNEIWFSVLLTDCGLTGCVYT